MSLKERIIRLFILTFKPMKKIYYKIVVYVFVGFISLTLVCSFVVSYKDIISSLYESKETIFSFEFSSSYFNKVIDIVDNIYSNNVFLHRRYVDLFGGMQRAIGKSIIWESDPNKTIMIGSDGKLYSSGNITMNFADYTINENQLNSYAEKLSDLGAFANSNGAQLVFFQAPARYDSEYVQLPIAVNDSSRENVNYLYEQLINDNNLIVLNSQYLYKEQNIGFEDLFYKTDHHWTVKTAFWAYIEICKVFNEIGIGIDQYYYDISNYNYETEKNAFLGSLGERVGELYVGRDDFDLIYPKFDTDYIKLASAVYNKSITQGGSNTLEGGFTDAILSYEAIKTKQIKVTLGSYVSGDISEVIIKNKKPATDKKILILKDSFALPVSAFLSTCFEEEIILDPRYYNEKTIYEYIAEYQPDVVLVLYNPNAYNSTFFNFCG